MGAFCAQVCVGDTIGLVQDGEGESSRARPCVMSGVCTVKRRGEPWLMMGKSRQPEEELRRRAIVLRSRPPPSLHHVCVRRRHAEKFLQTDSYSSMNPDKNVG